MEEQEKEGELSRYLNTNGDKYVFKIKIVAKKTRKGDQD